MQVKTETRTYETVKTKDELEKIGAAAALGDMCFTHILNFIKPGMSELDVAKEIDRFLLSNGGEGLAFDTICVSGSRSALPHGEPSEKLIEKGELLTMDFGAIIGGYCGDMTRTIGIGYLDEEQKNVYNTVLQAQLAACDIIKAGLPCQKADFAARDIIDKAGFGDYFVHGLGHGVGQEVHENPRLNSTSEDILEEDMAVTIEPGIYIPEKYGVRIEDLAIVKSFGIINLVNSTKELIII